MMHHKRLVDPDSLKETQAVHITHISVQTPILSAIKEVENNHILLCASKQMPDAVIGDPIICKYFRENIEYILTGDITDIYDNNSFRILVTQSTKYDNKRKHHRHGVSLNAVVVGLDSLDYICSTLKSISYSGLGLNCRYEYDIGRKITISILVPVDEVITVIGKVIRKNPLSGYYEYGIELDPPDPVNKEKLKRYLKGLEEKENNFFTEHNKS